MTEHGQPLDAARARMVAAYEAFSSAEFLAKQVRGLAIAPEIVRELNEATEAFRAAYRETLAGKQKAPTP